MKVIVLTPILFNGEHQEIGTELDVPEGFAREMISWNKCAPVGSPAAEATQRLATEPKD